jgi:hypothetical protein
VSELDENAPQKIQHLFRWDLDKTYLHTDFDTLIDIVRTAVEKPEGKRTVPGAAALIRELRTAVPSKVTILSGSPEQMRATLESKLRLDGVQWDEFVLKPSLKNLLRFRFRALRDQVGYKLPALLAARTRCPADVPETLFGDDAEADALIYSLYADILADRLNDKMLTAVMEHAHAYPDAISETIRLANLVERTNPVRRIFIHLDRKSEPAFFERYGARVVPVLNYFQAALALVSDSVLPPASALRVGAVLMNDVGSSVHDLARAARDLIARGHLALDALGPIAAAARDVDAPVPLDLPTRLALADALSGVRVEAAPRAEVPIDYLAALTDDRARWEAASKEAKSARSASKRKPREEK